ncbi:MAG: bluetail domain-containing putative surface protein, partial [Cyanobium sp.]
VFGLAIDSAGGQTLLDPAAFATLPRSGVQLADVTVLGSEAGERIFAGIGSLIDAAGGDDALFNTDSQGGNILVGGLGVDRLFLRPVHDQVIGGQLFSNAATFGLPLFTALVDRERDIFLIDSGDPGTAPSLQILDYEPLVDQLLVDGVAPAGDWTEVRQQLEALNVSVNAAPQLSATPITISIQPGTIQTLDLSPFASDADGDSLQLFKLSGPAWISAAGTSLSLTAPDDLSAEQLAATELVLAFSDGQAVADFTPALNLAAPPPPLPVLAINATDADRPEGNAGATPFTFTVTRSGDITGVSRATWTVTRGEAPSVSGADFAGSGFASGMVRFQAGETEQTIRVSVQGDFDQEANERFNVTLSAPSGASIVSSAATVTIRNDDLIGTARADRLSGSAAAEYINGLAGQDRLTGGRGPDLFVFAYGDSRLRTPDLITDFRFGDDRIAIFRGNGDTPATPANFSRAADNRTAATLKDLAAAVYTDADGRRRGNQPLGAAEAALVVSSNRAIAGTYLLINDKKAGLDASNDLMIEISGYSGKLPGLGSITGDGVFS